MPTPQEEQIDAADLQNDQSRISDLLTKVSPDGHEVLEEAPTPQVEVVEPEVVEPEAQPTGDPSSPTETPETEALPAVTLTDDVPQDDYEREIEENYQPPKGASQRTTEVLKILKRINREEHRKAKDLEKEIQGWQAKKLLDENTEKELQDLRDLRSRVAIEQDPEFNEQYVQKIQQHEGRAMAILQHHAMPEETVKYIGEQGGLIRFQNSERRMPVGTQDLEGNPFTGTQAEWFKDVMEPMFGSLPTAARTRLKYELDEALKTAIQRDDALQEARGNPQKFIDQRQQKFQDQVQDFAKRADAQFQKEADLYGEIAKPKDIPEKATPAEKTAIEQHNAKIEEAKESIRRFIADQTPENLASMAAARAYRDFAQEHVKTVEKDRDDWKARALASEEKWNKAKSSAQTTRQQSTVQQPVQRTEQKPYDPADSIKELMSAIPA